MPKPKLVFTRNRNSPDDVPVMILLVPFCPDQQKGQFPSVEGAITSKVTAFALADRIQQK